MIHFSPRSVKKAAGILFLLLAVTASPLTATGQAARPPAGELCDPLELDGEPARWVKWAVPRELSPLQRLRALSRALLDPRKVGLREVGKRTPTAIEAFRERRADCVGYAMLFVGLAREVGVAAYFVMIEDLGRSWRRGDLRIAEAHLAAAYGVPDRLSIFDFGGESDGGGYQVRKISDRAAVALYHSNKGVELMLDGRHAEAADRLRWAADLAPSLAAVRVNLGVALRRLGDLEGAEAAYREALVVDPRAAAAGRGLAAVLRLQGRQSEADSLLADIARRRHASRRAAP